MYNSTMFEGVRRHIEITLEGYWPHYEWLMNKSDYIMQLTPPFIPQYELKATLKWLSQNENSTIPHFPPEIKYPNRRNHIYHNVLKF